MDFFMIIKALPYYFKYKDNEYASASKLKNIQCRNLKKILQFAYYNVPYYHELFKNAGITPDEITDFNDMLRIPISDKKSLRSAFPHNVIAKGYTENDYIHDHTSGSSGSPLVYVVDKKQVMIEGIVGKRVRGYGGKSWKDKVVHIAPAAGDSHRIEKFSMIRKLSRIIRNLPCQWFDISPWLAASKQLDLLKTYRPDIIIGFASSLRALAKSASENNSDLSPRVCFSTAEFLSEQDRTFIENALHTTVLRIYGSREFGEIAGECLEKCGYHINVDSVYLEIIKDGRHAKPGETGEIVITSLFNFAMPFIRYRIGDIGSISTELCPCGRTLPLLKEVVGRTSDMVTSPNGTIIVPEFFWNPWREIPGVLKAQLIQEKKDLLILRLVVSPEFDEEDTYQKLYNIYRQKMGDFILKFEFVDDIPRESSGKYLMVKSKIKIDLV